MYIKVCLIFFSQSLFWAHGKHCSVTCMNFDNDVDCVVKVRLVMFLHHKINLINLLIAFALEKKVTTSGMVRIQISLRNGVLLYFIMEKIGTSTFQILDIQMVSLFFFFHLNHLSYIYGDMNTDFRSG